MCVLCMTALQGTMLAAITFCAGLMQVQNQSQQSKPGKASRACPLNSAVLPAVALYLQLGVSKLCTGMKASTRWGASNKRTQLAGEEMGLGKTVEIAALMLSRPAPELQPAHQTTSDGLLVSRYSCRWCTTPKVLTAGCVGLVSGFE